MKGIVTMALLLLLGTAPRAQNAADSIGSLARQAESAGHHDESIRLYLLASSLGRDSVRQTLYAYNAGHTIVKNAAPGFRKDALRKALYLLPFGLGPMHLYWADELAGLYLIRQQFDSALIVLRHARQLKVLHRGCGLGMFDFYAGYHHKMMLAWEGLGQIDSAIKAFLPYAFDRELIETSDGFTYSTCHTGANDYHCRVVDFVRILRKKYSAEQLRVAGQKMLESCSMQKRPFFSGNSFEYTFTVHFLDEEVSPFGSICFADEALAKEYEADSRRLLTTLILYDLLREPETYF